MKVKTSVTLSRELLAALARFEDSGSRSHLLEVAGWNLVRDWERGQRYPFEVERLNAIAAGHDGLEPPDLSDFGAPLTFEEDA
ncbi:MAG: hypothetical protein ACR2HN_08570 [Tepidiformaceae bacterium]